MKTGLVSVLGLIERKLKSENASFADPALYPEAPLVHSCNLLYKRQAHASLVACCAQRTLLTEPFTDSLKILRENTLAVVRYRNNAGSSSSSEGD